MAPWATMTRPVVQEPADLASRPQPCPAALCPHESHQGWGSIWELHPALSIMTDENAASAARYPPQLSSAPRWPPWVGAGLTSAWPLGLPVPRRGASPPTYPCPCRPAPPTTGISRSWPRPSRVKAPAPSRKSTPPGKCTKACRSCTVNGTPPQGIRTAAARPCVPSLSRGPGPVPAHRP